MKYTKAQREIYKMLTENTGIHMCDSGGENDRHWQRNQNKTIDDFNNEPVQTFYLDEEGYVYRELSVFHYLSDLEIDEICEEFNKINTEADNWDSVLYGVSEEGENYLVEQGLVSYKFTPQGDTYSKPPKGEDREIIEPKVFNTYNGESDLLQTLQGYYLEGDEYVLIQVHGGADVRGGYTDARLFKLGGFQESINSYLRDWLDSDEALEELLHYRKHSDILDYNTDKPLSEKEIDKRIDR
jgi:hypothetical protein